MQLVNKKMFINSILKMITVYTKTSIENDREVLLCLRFDFGQHLRGTVHCIAFQC